MPTTSEHITFHPDELKTKEFNKMVDQLLTTGKVIDEDWHRRTKAQNEMYSVINRALARLSK